MKILTTQILMLLLSMLIISCGNAFRIPLSELNNSGELEYSIVFYIHGDSDYLYHDENGNPINADERAVEQAIKVADSLTNAEVFIFHQKRDENFLFFFPRDDKEYYYYRNGRRIVQVTRDNEVTDFLDNEIKFFENYSAVEAHHNTKLLFFYFGHQIPEENKSGYFASFPKKQIGIDTLSTKVQKFALAVNHQKYNAAILSTCKSGTPFVANQFMKAVDFLIASPEDLHLSYMDIDYLLNLNKNVNISMNEFCENFSESSFQELTAKITTVVSISVYNLDKLKTKLLNYQKSDCSDIIKHLKNIDGVTVFYRSPKFGRQSEMRDHSGWSCVGNK